MIDATPDSIESQSVSSDLHASGGGSSDDPDPARFDPLTIALVAHNRAARAVFDSWGYRTTRPLNTVVGRGYFDGLRGLKVGDGIRVTRVSNDGRRLLDAAELVVAEVMPSVRVVALLGATADDFPPCHRRF